MNKSDRQLLKEYVRLLTEEDNSWGGDEAYGSGFGGMHVDSSVLYKAFIQPFTDVVKTAAGASKEVIKRMTTLAKVSFETVATTIVPILNDSYDEIFEEEKESLEKIRGEYADVYERNFKAFQHHDVMFAAFLYDPGKFLTRKVARAAPKVAAKLLSVVTGGAFDNAMEKLFKNDDKDTHGLVGGKAGALKLALFGESVITEANDVSFDDVFASKKVKERIETNPTAIKMRKHGAAVVESTVSKIVEHAKLLDKATTIADIEKIVGQKIKLAPEVSKMKPDERKAFESNIVASLKKGMKGVHAKQLRARAEEAIKAGVPREHPYVLLFLRAASSLSK